MAGRAQSLEKKRPVSLEKAALPLQRLSPQGWSRAVELCALTDEHFRVLPAPQAAVLGTMGDLAAVPVPNPTDLASHLKRQALVSLPLQEYVVVANLIEELDMETGLFVGDLAELSIIFGRPVEELVILLGELAGYSPRGCGSRTLHEALVSQIPDLPNDRRGGVARLLLTDYWETFTGGGGEILSELSGLGHRAIEEGIDTLRSHLTPYPAERFWGRNGEHLRRGACHVIEDAGGTHVSPPHPAEFCAALPPGKGSEVSRIVFAGLKHRSTAYSRLPQALSILDLDDPGEKMDLEALADRLKLKLWHAWLFTEGEMLVNSDGERRYLREIIEVRNPSARLLFSVLDTEAREGLSLTDRELSERSAGGRENLDPASIKALRRALGIPGRRVRCHPLVQKLLS